MSVCLSTKCLKSGVYIQPIFFKLLPSLYSIAPFTSQLRLTGFSPSIYQLFYGVILK